MKASIGRSWRFTFPATIETDPLPPLDSRTISELCSLFVPIPEREAEGTKNGSVDGRRGLGTGVVEPVPGYGGGLGAGVGGHLDPCLWLLGASWAPLGLDSGHTGDKCVGVALRIAICV